MVEHIISFSGGKDSTAMLLMMLEKGMPIDRIISIDTTKEFPEMYSHIEKVQKLIEPLTIEIFKIDFDYWFCEHSKTRGRNKGKHGYGWPDFKNRWCTALKRELFLKKAFSTGNRGIVEYFGIAKDEEGRAKNNKTGRNRNIQYPLVDWDITEAGALEYCYDRGLDWGGLYRKMVRVSCWCCPLSRIGELKILYKEYPELWQKLKEMDKKSYRRFRSDYSVDQLEDKFKYCIY